MEQHLRALRIVYYLRATGMALLAESSLTSLADVARETLIRGDVPYKPLEDLTWDHVRKTMNVPRNHARHLLNVAGIIVKERRARAVAHNLNKEQNPTDTELRNKQRKYLEFKVNPKIEHHIDHFQLQWLNAAYNNHRDTVSLNTFNDFVTSSKSAGLR